MSQLIPASRKEIRDIKRLLRKADDVVCLDRQSYVKTLLVAQTMAMLGEEVKAKIKRGYDTKEAK